ncbi:MAG: sialate O-acetylesterase [Akkermansiaceae bacterium]|nr:sialate O-acetylesterase [Akkermansiaceae bacterium]
MNSCKIKATCMAVTLAVSHPFVAGAKPLKVFILAGQSNMQGQAKESTLAGLAMDPETKPLCDKLVDGSGKTRVHDHVWIAAFSRTDAWGKTGDAVEKHGKLTVGYGGNTTDAEKLGPELGFGVTMVENLKEPILIIKTSWGGKSLKLDFRPPSGGPFYDHPEEVKDRVTGKGQKITAAEEIAQKVEATGKYYRLMLEHVRSVLADPGKYCPAYDPKEGCELAGFAWFQGFNDLVGPYPTADSGDKKKGGAKDYSEYSRLLACLIRDVRKDLSAPNLPFAIGVLGVGGKTANENTILFRKAMAAPAAMEEFKGTVKAVNTADFWDEKLGELEARKALANADPRKQGRGQRDPQDPYAELRRKLAPLQQELADVKEQKGGGRSKAKIEEISQRIQDVLFTPEEQEYIARNRSNQGYHYLGSAKTYSRIGEALAKAIVEMRAKGS